MGLQYLTVSRTPCRIPLRKRWGGTKNVRNLHCICKRFPEISVDIVMSVLYCYYGNILYIVWWLYVYTKRLTHTTIKVQQRR